MYDSSIASRGRVTAVLGPTNTGKTHLAVERMLGQQCLPRRMSERDIAEMALFLASDVSSGCTAQEWIVDGGLI